MASNLLAMASRKTQAASTFKFKGKIMDTILVSSYVSLFGLVSYYLVNYNCITTTSFRCDPPIKHGRACCLTDEDNKKSYRKDRPLQTTHFHHELWFHEPIQMAKFGTSSSPSPEPGDIKTREPSQKSIPLEGPSRPKRKSWVTN